MGPEFIRAAARLMWSPHLTHMPQIVNILDVDKYDALPPWRDVGGTKGGIAIFEDYLEVSLYPNPEAQQIFDRTEPWDLCVCWIWDWYVQDKSPPFESIKVAQYIKTRVYWEVTATAISDRYPKYENQSVLTRLDWPGRKMWAPRMHRIIEK